MGPKVSHSGPLAPACISTPAPQGKQSLQASEKVLIPLTWLFTSLGRVGTRRFLILLAKGLTRMESLPERRGERLGKVRDDHSSPVLQKGTLSPRGEGTCLRLHGLLETGLGVDPEPHVDGGREFSGSRGWRLSQKSVLDTRTMAIGISPHSPNKEKWREATRS